MTVDGDFVKDVYKKFVLKDQFWGRSLGQPFDVMKKAAVLVPLVVVSGTLHVWLTKRSQNVRHDKGHVCFPGGMMEDSDKNEVDTALREAHEEIGVEPCEVEVIGAIVPYISIRKIFVVPVIALVNETFRPKINSEVEVAFKIPLSRFLTNDRYHSMLFQNDLIKEMQLLHYFYDSVEGQDVLTFGLTASILVDISLAFFKREPDFNGTNGVFYETQNPFDDQAKFLSKFGDLKWCGILSPKVKL